MRRSPALVACVALLGAAATLPAAAGAKAPTGSWSLLRKDAFRHYACKERHRTDGPYWVRTWTDIAGSTDALRHEIGVWAVVTRRRNGNVVSERTTTRWRGGTIRTTLRHARSTDRAWAQGSYYGPTEPWSDGDPVRSLRTCD